MPNQARNCTVWIIQYSYAVDYYCMNCTAHFFTLILPRKVQYMCDTALCENIEGRYNNFACNSRDKNA